MAVRWPIELTRAVGSAEGKAKDIAKFYGVSTGGVYCARKFVAAESAGHHYDEKLHRWVWSDNSDFRP